MFLKKEATWTQNLAKDQYEIVGKTRVLKDPLIRESQRWLSERFVDSDYTNDAIFESFRDYPRKKHLYRKHKDIAKDYERKLKFYKSCQRWYSTETNRQIQKVEERFSRLLQYTFDSNRRKTKGLRKSYTKWISEHHMPIDLAKFHNPTQDNEAKVTEKTDTEIETDNIEGNITKVNSPTVDREQTLRNLSIGETVSSVVHSNRHHGYKSISLENLPDVEESQRAIDLHPKPKDQEDLPEIEKSISSLTVRDIRQIKPKRFPPRTKLICQQSEQSE